MFLSPAGLLQPLSVPDQIREHLSMDFIEGLPISRGYDSILVVLDRLSKYVHFILLQFLFNVQTVAKILTRELVRLHSIPQSIISDRDKVFHSFFLTELFPLQGSALERSTTFHLKINW